MKDLSIFEGHVQELLDRLPTDSKTSVDLAQLFSDFTVEMATDFLFGGSESCSTTSSVTPAAFAAALDRGQKAVRRNFVLCHLARLLPFAAFKADCRIVQSFVAPYVEKALHNAPSITNPPPPNFLTSMSSQTRSPTLLTGALLNNLLAGRDTTASLLSNLFFTLSISPDILTTLQCELAALNLTGPSTTTDLKNLPYLQHCVLAGAGGL